MMGVDSVDLAIVREYHHGMEDWINLDDAGLLRLARSIERDCQEYVKWEIRKLAWIREEKQQSEQRDSEAA